jgi:ATP-dependent protease ClpP protease subunit
MLESEAMLEEMEVAEDPLEFAIIGDLSDSESDLSEKILSVPIGGECTIFFDSPGGSVYSALSLMTLIATREIRATGIITGECSSAAIWPFAACCYRKVTPFSVMLFHRMKWQSEEQVGLGEASEWARHFAQLEQEMDSLLTRFFGTASQQVEQWIRESRYITGRELVEAGLADLVELSPVRPLRGESNNSSPGAQQESDKLKTAHVA